MAHPKNPKPADASHALELSLLGPGLPGVAAGRCCPPLRCFLPFLGVVNFTLKTFSWATKKKHERQENQPDSTPFKKSLPNVSKSQLFPSCPYLMYELPFPLLCLFLCHGDGNLLDLFHWSVKLPCLRHRHRDMNHLLHYLPDQRPTPLEMIKVRYWFLAVTYSFRPLPNSGI